MTNETNLMPEGDQKADAEQIPSSASFKRDLYFYLQNLVYAILVLILLFTFIGRIIGVSGSSMNPTLYDGDLMVLQSIFYEPEQGDVVVLTKESFEEQALVKRVIAVGGQTIKIDYDTNTVYVDGVAIDEPYIKEVMTARPDYYISEAVIPEGCIFVMGDNRNDSSDSRYPEIGIIDERCVIGHAICVLFPFSDFGFIR